MRNQFLVAAAFGIIFAAYAGAEPAQKESGQKNRGFQGYWMGVDPVDGGDARRSLLQLPDGKYALAARDSVLTLCDGTDRAFASFNDGQVIGRNVMQSNTLTIQCFNNGASVVLHVRYELLDSGLMAEIATHPDGSPVSTIILHKVSLD